MTCLQQNVSLWDPTCIYKLSIKMPFALWSLLFFIFRFAVMGTMWALESYWSSNHSYQTHSESLNSLQFPVFKMGLLWGLSSIENVSGKMPNTQQVLGKRSYSCVKTDISYLLMWIYFKCIRHMHIRKLLTLENHLNCFLLLVCGLWYCCSRKALERLAISYHVY